MRKYDMISGLAQYTADDVVRNEDNLNILVRRNRQSGRQETVCPD